MATKTRAPEATPRQRVAPTPSGQDLANASTAELLSTYWRFVQSSYAGVAAIMVSTLGEAKSAAVATGELAALIEYASGLQKAHGKNISAATVRDDLGVEVPPGFTPTFDLYLRACGIRPDTNDSRAVARTVMTAIRVKIREIKKLNDQAA